MHSAPRQPGPDCRIPNWRGSARRQWRPEQDPASRLASTDGISSSRRRISERRSSEVITLIEEKCSGRSGARPARAFVGRADQTRPPHSAVVGEGASSLLLTHHLQAEKGALKRAPAWSREIEARVHDYVAKLAPTVREVGVGEQLGIRLGPAVLAHPASWTSWTDL